MTAHTVAGLCKADQGANLNMQTSFETLRCTPSHVLCCFKLCVHVHKHVTAAGHQMIEW